MRTQVREGTEDWRIAHITADEFREPDPVLFWRPVARRPYNSQRFKGPEVAVPKPDRVFRIICYGDSNTEGLPESSWPEELQKILDRENISGEWRYEVLNAGVAGYSSYQGLMRFRQEVGVYEPDLIFVSFGWNDLPIAVDAPDKQFQPPHPLLVFLERILLKYRFYLSLKYYFKKIRKPFKADANSQPRVSLQDYVMNLNGFSDTARRHGVSPVLLTRPHWKTVEKIKLEVLDEASSWRAWRARVPLYNEALLKLAKSKGVLVIDVQKIFEASPDLFVDDAHFNLRGRKKMAEVLYQELLKNSHLPMQQSALLARISHE